MSAPIRLVRGMSVAAVLSLVSPSAFAELVTAELPAVANAPQASPRWIRVAVAQRQPEVELAIHGHFRIVALQTTEVLREGPSLPEVSIRANHVGILVGEQLMSFVGLRVEVDRDATIDLNGRRLRGTLEILKQADRTLLVINHVDLEDYLRGVLAKEAPHYWPREALRALAISARTYALFQRLSKTTVEYDVTGDVLSQVYGGKTAERWETSRAVKETEGLILVYHDQVFPAFYHSTCGGLTEDASVMGPFDVKPLKGGIACSFCAASPFYRWQRRLSLADVAWAVKKQGRGSLSPITDVGVLSYSPTGRVAWVRIRGAGRTLDLSGYEFRQLFGFDRIRSTGLTILRDGDGIILQGHGWGHGVGLCQWGAAALAHRGLSASEILAYYYPGATLMRLRERPIQPIPVEDTTTTTSIRRP